VGIQHVAQWFEEHEIGTAEGLYAGTGNVGAGVGAMMLPRIYGTDYKTAFIHLGIVAFILAFLYILRGVPARSEELAARAKKHASLKRMFYIFTRWGAIALMLQYAMSFGYEIALNAWLLWVTPPQPLWVLQREPSQQSSPSTPPCGDPSLVTYRICSRSTDGHPGPS